MPTRTSIPTGENHGATPATVHPLERRVLADATLDVVIGDGVARAVRFVDADGTAATVSVRGGTATVRFTGAGLAQTAEGRELVVGGTGVAVSSVTAAGTSRRSRLTFAAAGGDERLTVHDVAADASVGAIRGPDVVLTGRLTTAGSVQRIELLRTENATITLGGGAASSVAIEEAINTDLASAAPLRRLDLFAWSGTDGGGTITAPSIGRAIVGRDFSGDIITGPVDSLVVGLVMQNANVRVAGPLGRLRLASANNVRMNVAGDIRSVSIGYLTQSQIYAGVRPLPEGSPVPSDLADFVAPFSIGRLRVSQADASGGSVIAAHAVRTAYLKLVDLTDAPRIVVAADTISRVTARAYILAGKSLRTVRVPVLEDEAHSLGSVELRAL